MGKDKLVFEDGEEIVLQDDQVLVPEDSGWFSFTTAIESIEKYGLTWDEYHRMLDDQGGNCAICKRHPTSVGPLAVDHDHESGKVRGLLCRRCNLGLGLFLDDPESLKRGRDYLYERGCWLTRTPTDEKQQELAQFTFTPEEYIRQQVGKAERGWIGALRAVLDCQRGRKEAPLEDAWDRFWQTFRECTHGYQHPERALFRARDEWVRLGGVLSEFRTP